MAKISFIISDENDRQLLEIQQKYSISKSDAVRRGIAMLHDYLLSNIQPEDSKTGKIEAKENGEAAG